MNVFTLLQKFQCIFRSDFGGKTVVNLESFSVKILENLVFIEQRIFQFSGP